MGRGFEDCELGGIDELMVSIYTIVDYQLGSFTRQVVETREKTEASFFL